MRGKLRRQADAFPRPFEVTSKAALLEAASGKNQAHTRARNGSGRDWNERAARDDFNPVRTPAAPLAGSDFIPRDLQKACHTAARASD
jgi:hypothetical protein